MIGYDAWLERPYDHAAERPVCPECGVQMEEDTAERSVDCPGCGYGTGFDWEAAA